MTDRVFDVYGDDTVVHPRHGDDTTRAEEHFAPAVLAGKTRLLRLMAETQG